MDDRFPESNLTLFRQMSSVTEKRLKSAPFNVKEEYIRHQCERYEFEAHQAIKELERFVSCYVDLDDDNQSNKSGSQEVAVSTGQQQQPDSPDSSSGNESEVTDAVIIQMPKETQKNSSTNIAGDLASLINYESSFNYQHFPRRRVSIKSWPSCQ